MNIAIRRLPHAQGLPLPAYATPGSAGMDVCAAVDAALDIAPGEVIAIPTGFAIAVPEGYEAQIRPRSGLALKSGITVLNTPGTIDSDYRGEVCIILINHSAVPFTVARGARIAQIVIAAHARANWQETATLEDTMRGAGGFGSTGTNV